jgi:transcriptional regulator GlxA family with amidase domain
MSDLCVSEHYFQSKNPDEISTFIEQIYSGNQFLPRRMLKQNVSIVGRTWDGIGFYEFDSRLPFNFVTDEIRPSYLFLSCTRGNATRSHGKEATECGTGDVVATSSAGVARCVSGDQGFGHLSLVISSGRLNDFVEQWIGQPLDAPIEFELRPLSPEVAADWNSAADCLRLMATMNHPPEIAAQAMQEHMFKLLVTGHPNNHSRLLTYERYAQERTVSLAVEMIRREPMQWRTLGAIAHKLGCPMSDLENGILRFTGKRWAEFYLEARLDGVKRALSRGSDKFIATLRAYGFSLSGRFVRTYARRFGELPSTTYRKNPNAIDVIQASPPISEALCQRTIDRFIDASLGKAITLADLAQLVEMSEHVTIAAFRQQFMRTPMGYVIERRLSRAHWLLQNTSVSILAIALECGFGSQSYMTTLIKRHHGVTPRQLRLAGRAQDTIAPIPTRHGI